MRTLRSKYFNPGIIEVEIFKCQDDLMYPHFNITEEDFVRWLGKVRIDNVVGINDLAWLMKIKRKYEEGKNLVEA